MHNITRKYFLAWREDNNPRDVNNIFLREMIISRARFLLALCFIRGHENQIRQNAIAQALCDDGEDHFQKEIKKLTPNNLPYPSSIDDTTLMQLLRRMLRK